MRTKQLPLSHSVWHKVILTVLPFLDINTLVFVFFWIFFCCENYSSNKQANQMPQYKYVISRLMFDRFPPSLLSNRVCGLPTSLSLIGQSVCHRNDDFRIITAYWQFLVPTWGCLNHRQWLPSAFFVYVVWKETLKAAFIYPTIFTVFIIFSPTYNNLQQGKCWCNMSTPLEMSEGVYVTWAQDGLSRFHGGG